MKLDVLAIGAHPDDVDLSCGGTIIKLVKQGHSVGLVDLTRGELGTRGTPELRQREAAASATIIGAAVRENLGIPDGNIESSMEHKLRLVQVIRRYRPDVLVFPYSVDRHPDHERAYTLCREAWFLAGLEKIQTSEGGALQDPHRPRAYYHFMQWYEFPPTFIIDVSNEFEQRMECVKAFHSQFYNPHSDEPDTILSTPEFLEMLQTRLAYYGDRIGVRYGEPFYSVFPLKVQDLFFVNT